MDRSRDLKLSALLAAAAVAVACGDSVETSSTSGGTGGGSASATTTTSSSSTGGMAGDGAEQKAALDACGLPSPCPAAQFTYGIEPEAARQCFWTTMEQATPAHLSWTGVPDGGGVCKSEVALYVAADRSVLVWNRIDNDCSFDPAAVDYEWSLERCTLKDAQFFIDCAGQMPDPIGTHPCDFHNTWYTGCAAAEPSCP